MTTRPVRVTLAEVRNILRRLSLSEIREFRYPPDNRRRGQFKAGWEDFTTGRHANYTEETLERLTWHNLGYRFGKEVGSSTDDINTYYDHLVHLWANPGQSDSRDPDTFESGDITPYDPDLSIDGRVRAWAEITQRPGQVEFRRNVIDAYSGRCAITRCDVKEALHAAHIDPHSGSQSDVTPNGILLRADIHHLFDAFLISINPDSLTVCLSSTLIASSYGPFEGHAPSWPERRELWPNQEALRRHFETFTLEEEVRSSASVPDR